MTRRAVRLFCLIAAVGLLVSFGMWSFENADSLDSRPDVRVVTSRFALGLPFSPWFEYVARDERTELPGGGWRQKRAVGGHVLLLSWSWMLLAGVSGCVVVFRRLRPRATEADREHRDQAGTPQAHLRDPR
jgi:hypothetical protein